MSSTTIGLAKILDLTSELMSERAELDDKIKDLSQRIKELESQASELLGTEGIERMTVGGRTWWSEESMSLSIPRAMRDDVLRAAEKEGMREEIEAVANATLKSWAVERSKEQGLPLSEAFSGTAFEDVVSPYCFHRLRSRAVAKRSS